MCMFINSAMNNNALVALDNTQTEEATEDSDADQQAQGPIHMCKRRRRVQSAPTGMANQTCMIC